MRLGLCNLSCEWCDTPWTWDASRFDVEAESPETSVTDIVARLGRLGAYRGDLVTLSGGEPLLHHQRLGALFAAGSRFTWHAETNGTIPPPAWWGDHVAHTCVSPKVNTADPVGKRIKARALEGWAGLAREGRASFKFVASTPADVDRFPAVAVSDDDGAGGYSDTPTDVRPFEEATGHVGTLAPGGGA